MRIFRNILKGSTLATALFIFQACYGTPQGALYDQGVAPMSFTLQSAATGEPLNDITISVQAYNDRYDRLGVTGEDGKCDVEIPYARNTVGPNLRFQDKQGQYAVKDTMLADLREREIIISLKPAQ